jgi:hypothetical protein
VKGQLMLITAVIISLMVMATGSAISSVGGNDFNYRKTGYMSDIISEEASKVDMRFRKDRENFRKMIGFLNGYTTEVRYSEINRCFNVSLSGTGSELTLSCTS